MQFDYARYTGSERGLESCKATESSAEGANLSRLLIQQTQLISQVVGHLPEESCAECGRSNVGNHRDRA